MKIPDTASERKDAIANIAQPIAEKLARKEARKFVETPFAPRMDYNECLSAANLAITEVINRYPHLTPDEPDAIKQLATVAIQYKLIELKRQTLGRNTRKPGALSLNYTPPDEGSKKSDYKELLSVRFNIPTYTQLTDDMKNKLKSRLNAREYKCLCTTMDHPGDSPERMAESIGVSISTFSQYLNSARRKLENEYPWITRELLAKSGNAESTGFTRRF